MHALSRTHLVAPPARDHIPLSGCQSPVHRGKQPLHHHRLRFFVHNPFSRSVPSGSHIRDASSSSRLQHVSPRSHNATPSESGQQSVGDRVVQRTSGLADLNIPATSPLSPIIAVDPVTSTPAFLGTNSVLPSLLGLSTNNSFRLSEGLSGRIEEAMFTSYPFLNIWSPPVSLKRLCSCLPSDADVYRLWQHYQETAYISYPILEDCEEFEAQLCSFLESRNHHAKDDETPSTWDPSVLGLIFAVLALGAQYCENNAKERDLTSKVFSKRTCPFFLFVRQANLLELVCSSMQCLRIANFLAAPRLVDIRTQLLITICLRDNMQINTAWNLMGMSYSNGDRSLVVNAQNSQVLLYDRARPADSTDVVKVYTIL